MSKEQKRRPRRRIPIAIGVAIITVVGTIMVALIQKMPAPHIAPTEPGPTTALPPTFTITPSPSATVAASATSTLTPTSTSTSTNSPFPPALEMTLVTPPAGGIPPRALVIEAEDMGVFAEVSERAHAFGKKAVLLKAGDKITFTLNIEQEGWYILYIRHSNDNLNTPYRTELLEVFLDDIGLGQFRTADTGDAGRGWDIFSEPPFGDLFLSRGPHQIKLIVTGGDNFGINIDAIILVKRE